MINMSSSSLTDLYHYCHLYGLEPEQALAQMQECANSFPQFGLGMSASDLANFHSPAPLAPATAPAAAPAAVTTFEPASTSTSWIDDMNVIMPYHVITAECNQTCFHMALNISNLHHFLVNKPTDIIEAKLAEAIYDDHCHYRSKYGPHFMTHLQEFISYADAHAADAADTQNTSHTSPCCNSHSHTTANILMTPTLKVMMLTNWD